MNERAGDEPQRLQDELDAARAALGEFAYVVSHDLRANLRHITAYSGLLREELGQALGDDAKKYLLAVTSAARNMGQQIDGLMAWSRLDRESLQPMPLDVSMLVDEARAALADEFAGREVQWQLAPDLPCVQGDAVLLRQLFVHLLSNALKFSRARAPAVIEIGWQPPAEGSGWVTLFVRDNGVGFNPAQQDRLFHVFHRLHSTAQFEGQGLGLALARKIVERHGGRINAESAPEAGCRISFSLPLA